MIFGLTICGHCLELEIKTKINIAAAVCGTVNRFLVSQQFLVLLLAGSLVQFSCVPFDGIIDWFGHHHVPSKPPSTNTITHSDCLYCNFQP